MFSRWWHSPKTVSSRPYVDLEEAAMGWVLRLCGGFTPINLSYCNRDLFFMTNISYLAHTTPLLIKHGLLNLRDMYTLKLLKFCYKLSYDLLPP